MDHKLSWKFCYKIKKTMVKHYIYLHKKNHFLNLLPQGNSKEPIYITAYTPRYFPFWVPFRHFINLASETMLALGLICIKYGLVYIEYRFSCINYELVRIKYGLSCF